MSHFACNDFYMELHIHRSCLQRRFRLQASLRGGLIENGHKVFSPAMLRAAKVAASE